MTARLSSPKSWDIWRRIAVHSCEPCRDLDGQCWETGTDHPVPPLHRGCACFIEVVDVIDGDKPSGVGGSEESMSGKVKAFDDKLEPWELRTEATIASALWVLDGDDASAG